MIYRNFGNSGLKISAISLGTATYNNNFDNLETNQKTIEVAESTTSILRSTMEGETQKFSWEPFYAISKFQEKK